MRKPIIFILILVFLLMGTDGATAQLPGFYPLPFVYRIKSGQCSQEPSDRIQTGFRVKGQIGIVTALHGVVGCPSITAQPGDGTKTFTNLVIGKVDIRRDMALLWSSDLANISADGFEIISRPSIADTVDLQLVGYPWGMADQQPLYNIVFAQEAPLVKILPGGDPQEHMADRRSPALDVKVYRLQADIVPGHSGAPLMTQSQYILGVGNGGLDLGRVGWSWAIPLHAVEWKAVSAKVSKRVSLADQEELLRLERFRLQNLFGFATPDYYLAPKTSLGIPETRVDAAINAVFVKIGQGYYEFGSTYVQANKGLEICNEYSNGLCGWEAFADEIVDPNWRGSGELPDFWIMETEVTNAQYDACIIAGTCQQPDRKIRPSGPQDHPVRLGEVKYALDFARWACARLPTELEWEKAARGPDGLLYPWGNDWEPERANSCGAECAKLPQTGILLPDDGFPETAPVIEFDSGRSPYGLYHMAGNVREWTSRAKDRPGISHDYMMKGGSFYDFPDVLRTADRLRSPIDRDGTVTAGFRIVRDSMNSSCP